ncbi:unnamed protein product [Urochloa humidicola]
MERVKLATAMGKLLFLVLRLSLFLPHAAAAAAGRCVRQCGSTLAPYPFGFSGDCPILLICNATASAALLPRSTAAASYPIKSFNTTTSTFVVSVPPSCNRTVTEVHSALAGNGAGYGVSYRTGIFLSGNCTRRGSTAAAPAPAAAAPTFNCSVSSQFMTQILRRPECGWGLDSSWTCVATTTNVPNNSTAPRGQFMDWNDVKDAECRDAVTAALYADTAAGVPSVEFGVAEMGWWLDGTCAAAANATAGVGKCAANATCYDVETPNGAWGHRCACRDGIFGDGFAAGEGCHYDDAGSSKKFVVIVAGVVAGVVAAGGALLVCLVQCRRCRARRWSSSERLAAMRLLSEAAASSGVPVYSYAEVSRATNSFSHTHGLGTGAYGTVYVGKLPGSTSPSLVAIKRLHCRHHYDSDGDGNGDAAAAAAQLLNEIKLISSVSHPNLVRLLGCCLDRGEQILVYEYVPNGTLSHHLAAAGSAAGATLPWRARLVVAAETAAAIAHLHGMRPPIFHRDVKSSNILLDASLRPKLADFGLSRAGAGGDRLGGGATRSHVSTAPQGTPGYVDPEYHQCFHLSDKSDVYSFGVVLLELITAMKVVDFDRPAAEVNLASLALDRIGKGRVAEIVDPAILAGGEEWMMESVRHVSELAFRCLAFHKDVRPAMSEVAAELCRIRDAAPPESSSDDHPGQSRIRPMMMDVHVDVSLDGVAAAGNKKAVSPVSVQEVWASDHSSPSTNGSMPRSGA